MESAKMCYYVRVYPNNPLDSEEMKAFVEELVKVTPMTVDEIQVGLEKSISGLLFNIRLEEVHGQVAFEILSKFGHLFQLFVYSPEMADYLGIEPVRGIKYNETVYGGENILSPSGIRARILRLPDPLFVLFFEARTALRLPNGISYYLNSSPVGGWRIEVYSDKHNCFSDSPSRVLVIQGCPVEDSLFFLQVAETIYVHILLNYPGVI